MSRHKSISILKPLVYIHAHNKIAHPPIIFKHFAYKICIVGASLTRAQRGTLEKLKLKFPAENDVIQAVLLTGLKTGNTETG